MVSKICRSKNNYYRTNKRTSLLCLKMATDLPNLKGQLHIRGGPEYEESRCRNFARNAHNRDNNTKEKDNHQPAYIAVCEVVEDVQASIKFAQSNNLTVTVRTGGHNWFGCFLRNDVFLIDMQKFNQLNIDSSSSIARAGPAVVGTDLNDKAEVHGLCFPSGHCPGVPIGGFLLGGGYGWFFPYYGYAAEYIEEVTLVTPKGEIVTAKEGDDWLWMARGSASAFPGVVVEYKLRLAPLPKIIRMKTEFFPIVSYETVVRFANEFITKHSGESQKLELTVNLASTPPPMAEVVKAPKVFMVTQTWMADSEEDFHNQVAPLMTDKFPVKPLVAGEFQDFSSFSGLSSILGPAYPSGQHWISRALEYRANTFQDVAWENVQQEFVDQAPLGLSHCLLTWCPPKPVSKSGSYGIHSGRGFLTLVLGVHGSEESSTTAQEYVDTMMSLLDKHANKYDTLEHPLNRETFAKSFEDSDKILQIRSKLDPYKLLFDPSNAEPSH